MKNCYGFEVVFYSKNGTKARSQFSPYIVFGETYEECKNAVKELSDNDTKEQHYLNLVYEINDKHISDLNRQMCFVITV